MSKTQNCYKTCINKRYILHTDFIKHAESIVSKLRFKSTNVGRKPLDFERVLNGIYYLLNTGIEWSALPHCFGSSSAVHRIFQELVNIKFFEKTWHDLLIIYNTKHGLNLKIQAGDSAHIKAPLGKQKTGKSPVDRGKIGTKRSIIVEETGLVIGAALGPGNMHDSKLFKETLLSIPKDIEQPFYKEMHLDAAYDSKDVHTALFNTYYVPFVAKNNRRSKTKTAKKTERKRWVVERSHSWINRFRRLLIRYEKYAKNYLALMQFAFSIITFRRLVI